jgi:hypothetical protein
MFRGVSLRVFTSSVCHTGLCPPRFSGKRPLWHSVPEKNSPRLLQVKQSSKLLIFLCNSCDDLIVLLTLLTSLVPIYLSYLLGVLTHCVLFLLPNTQADSGYPTIIVCAREVGGLPETPAGLMQDTRPCFDTHCYTADDYILGQRRVTEPQGGLRTGGDIHQASGLKAMDG